MGRLQYLERLALGRSAFEDLEDEDQVLYSPRLSGEPTINDDGFTRQQYNDKGRPISQATEERNAALRHAENAALSLVGVVERKDREDRTDEIYFRKLREEREDVLAAEHSFGEDLQLVLNVFCLTGYMTETLVWRTQIRLYAASRPFSSIIQGGLSAMRATGFWGRFNILFPGAVPTFAHSTIRVILHALLSSGMEVFSERLIRRGLKGRKGRRVINILYYICETLLVGIDIFLLPLAFHAYAQQLGLALTWPLLPSWRAFSPSDPASVHSFCWKPLISIPYLGKLCSPAALVLFESLLWREADDEIPAGNQFTQFRYGKTFNWPRWNEVKPKATEDPWGWVLYQGFNARDRLMRFFGYKVTSVGGTIRPPYAKYESDFIPYRSEADERGLTHIHRSTNLAHLAPRFLAQQIDVGYAKLLLLPLQGLVLRSITQSYLASSLPKTSLALSAMPHLYSPFTSPLISSTWSEAGSYISKLGLSLTLHAAMTTGTFFLVHRLARWQGLKNFDWGNPGRIGHIIYRAPDPGERPDYQE